MLYYILVRPPECCQNLNFDCGIFLHSSQIFFKVLYTKNLKHVKYNNKI